MESHQRGQPTGGRVARSDILIARYLAMEGVAPAFTMSLHKVLPIAL